MKRNLTIVTVLALAMLFPAALTAQRVGAHMDRPCLELNEEQQEKMEQLRMEYQMANIDRRADLRKLRLEMRMEFMKEDPDRTALERIADKMSTVRGELAKARIGHLLAVKKLLPPQQWKMYMRHHGKKHGGMRGFRGMHGAGMGAGGDGRMMRGGMRHPHKNMRGDRGMRGCCAGGEGCMTHDMVCCKDGDV